MNTVKTCYNSMLEKPFQIKYYIHNVCKQNMDDEAILSYLT